MQPEWVREIRSQCRRQKVPFFFKQWGGVQKARNGRELDGRTWDEMPLELPKLGPGADPRSRRLALMG